MSDTRNRKSSLGAVALAASGIALAAGAHAHKQKKARETMSPAEREAAAEAAKLALEQKRASVDRNNMRAVYDSKSTAYKAVKRAVDVVLSGAALVVFSPVFAATAIAILAEDGRPVIYAAPREGKDMKPFKMYKFRSMCKDADAKLAALLAKNEQTGAAFKIKDDPRITKVGKFIRKTSIDELPQLVNILKGEMSIVGPRAVAHTRPFTPYEEQRQIVRPGLTSYWAVGGRADMPWDEWVEVDVDYIQDMSLKTDVGLIAKTIGSVLGMEGSY